jgi:hypothetical protein
VKFVASDLSKHVKLGRTHMQSLLHIFFFSETVAVHISAEFVAPCSE